MGGGGGGGQGGGLGGGGGGGGGGKSGALREEMWKWRMDFWDPDHQYCMKSMDLPILG